MREKYRQIDEEELAKVNAGFDSVSSDGYLGEGGRLATWAREGFAQPTVAIRQKRRLDD